MEILEDEGKLVMVDVESDEFHVRNENEKEPK